MKHLLTAFACLFIMNMSAQTGFVEFPYNPDSDNDDMIGTEDLLGLLSLYGSEFSEEGLYLSTDSTDALYHTGYMQFYQCHKSCNELPGNWHIPTRNELYKHDLASLGDNTNCFIQPDQFLMPAASQNFRVNIGWSNVQNGATYVEDAQYLSQCYCAAHERPNVEYSYCRASDDTTFSNCCDDKVASGWYPLASTTGVSGNGYAGGTEFGQAFWRWAE